MIQSRAGIHIEPLREVAIMGQGYSPDAVPGALEHRADLGVIAARIIGGHGQRLHWGAPAEGLTMAPRCEPMPNGDLICMFPGRQGGETSMLIYRSRDRGFTWDGPRVAWKTREPGFPALPLSPKASNAVYAFGTQPRKETDPKGYAPIEGFRIGWRISTNSGHTWSDVRAIMPVNDQTFRGLALTRMCETDRGTWLLTAQSSGLNHGRREETGVVYSTHLTRLYLLRSEDRGRTWRVLPDARPSGWSRLQGANGDGLEDGRVLALGDGQLLILARASSGELMSLRSADDGRTWSAPYPSGLFRPDAIPVVTHLTDSRTLLAITCHVDRRELPDACRRAEIWVALSKDHGITWTEPRFLLADAAELPRRQPSAPDLLPGFPGCDVLVHMGRLHIFANHQHRQILHFSMAEPDLLRLPVVADLRAQNRTPAPG